MNRRSYHHQVGPIELTPRGGRPARTTTCDFSPPYFPSTRTTHTRAHSRRTGVFEGTMEGMPPHSVGMATYAMETRAYRYCTVVPPYGLVRLRVASGSRAHGAITRAAVLYTSRSAHPACRLCCPRGWSLIHTQWGLSHRNRARNAPKLKERLCLTAHHHHHHTTNPTIVAVSMRRG